MPNGFAEGDYILDRIDTWLLECYSLSGICEVQLGDIVLDCGTYSGNTTLYFSEKTGPSGHVYGFEAAKETFTRYCKNIEMHKNCSAIYSAVTKETGTVFFDGTSYGASIKNSGVTTPAIALDDFVRRQNLPSVDFIKMDIEGAEADALLGACDTIRRFKPKMAISAYHKPLDICDLPALISSISPGYTFFLRHYSDREFESVLFCVNNDIVQERDKTKFIADFTYSQITAFIKFFVWIINQIKVNPTDYPADYKKIVAACNDQFLQLNKSLEVIDKSTQLTDKLVRENEILRKNLEILKKNSMP
jgi:FkbM family methyltransferase